MSSSKGLSKHLSWAELACKDGTPYPQEWRTNRAIQLSEIFELIRKECGDKPIIITSAFRSPEHNRKIGGARHSQHVQGRAFDLKPTNMLIDDFYNNIKRLAKAGSLIRGIGKYRTFVHVDIRKSDKIIYWFGKGVKDDR